MVDTISSKFWVHFFCSGSFVISYILGKSINVNIGQVSALKSAEYSYLSPNCRLT